MTPRALYSPDPAAGWLPWGALTPLLGLVFIALPVIGSSMLLVSLGLADAQGLPAGIAGWLMTLLLPFPIIGLAVWGWVHAVERRPLRSLGLVRVDGAVRLFLRGQAIGIGCVLLIVLAIWLGGGYRAAGEVFAAFASIGALAGIVALLVGFVVQASVEEFVCRGWMLSAIARKLNVPLAVLLSSLVFTLLHYKPGQHALASLGTLVFSLFASGWALRDGHLWGVMGWHAGWNWLLAVGFELPLSGLAPLKPPLVVALSEQGPLPLTGGSYGPEASVLIIVFFGAWSVYLFARARSGVQPASSQPASA